MGDDVFCVWVNLYIKEGGLCIRRSEGARYARFIMVKVQECHQEPILIVRAGGLYMRMSQGLAFCC